MKPVIDIFGIFYIGGIILALFWTALLLSSKNRPLLSNRLLAVLLSLISLSILNAVLRYTKYIFAVPHLIGLTFPLVFLYPPLFYFYLRSLTSEKIRFRENWHHFIPFILSVIYIFPFYLEDGSTKAQFILSGGNARSAAGQFIAASILAQETFYIILSLRLLFGHSKKIRNSFSALGGKTLNWTRNLIVAYSCITLLFLVLKLFPASFQTLHLAPLAVFAFISVLGYMGISQSPVFEESDPKKTKYRKSGLSAEEADLSLKNLLSYMENEKPHLDPELSLNKLAAGVGIPPNHLSQIINEKLGRTFYEFVSRYRVGEAKKLLTDSNRQHLNILAIAYEAGFNSKSTFNSVFRKHEEMTPTQYRRKKGS